MKLYKGLLFHNRYLLVSSLGQGASAEVWRAKDTKANNLVVALKIFSQHSEMDSYGLQNFEREFTTVYNMKHSNLLPPTGYDICEGRPYLVMQYCENGSCSSMKGRMEEDDLIKFLHDVAAGLEYLHDNNIIHQDIKPDNILLDDNCNFMVTDFGISVSIGNGIYDSEGMSGGTRAYMGPERFQGVTNNASDMWSLGATAVELLTDNPPYGEHGGLLQAEGEPLPELPKLQPEVKAMILGCLTENPTKRIKAYEIRQKIELYWETGSWVKHSQKQTIILVATGVVSVLMCLGIFLWDYNRTKTYYYKDYCEYWGIPKGIGKLSKSEVKHKESSYKLEYKQRKLRHLSLVNSTGKVVPHTDTEHINSRFSDVFYFYTDNGNIDYKTIYDTNGTMLFKMDYDENLKTVTFRQNDEYGTELNLDANTNALQKGGVSVFDEKSHISRYILKYDNDGLLIERRYVGLKNISACDKDNIYGQRYKYDSKGRKIEEEFIGADGTTTSNNDGLAIKVYAYNDNDDWTSVSYLNVERKGSHDGNNCSTVLLSYDEYGNRIKETYFTLDGSPAIRTDINVAGFSYVYNEHGCCILQSCLGVDGMPAYCNAGYVTVKESYNENGFVVKREFLDEYNNAVLFNSNGDIYSSIIIKPNETDLPLETNFFDEYGLPMETKEGAFSIKNTYNQRGNLIRQQFYDKGGKPIAVDGFYYERVAEYDEFNRLVREYYLDNKGQLTTCDGLIADYRLEYNLQGALTKISYRDAKGDLVVCSDMSAGYTIDYDEIGNKRSVHYFNAEEKPCMIEDGYAKVEYSYNSKTNFLEEIRNYDVNGKLVLSLHYKYDSKGNVIEFYSLIDGKLRPGTAVEKKEFDINNRNTKEWYCDLKSNQINCPQQSYSLTEYTYDERGNCTMQTYWSMNGKPAIDENRTHKRIREFDMMNRIVCERNLGADSKPVTGTNVNPEARVKYDQWGNMAEVTCYDGYGKPRLSATGFFKKVMQYDRRGNIVYEEYYGTDNRLICSSDIGYAKANYTYDKHGNRLEAKYYDTSECIKIETWKYNDKNRFIEQRICNGNGKLSDEFYGVSRLTVDYDTNGVTPRVKKYYSQTGALLGSQTWNEKRGEWNELHRTGSSLAQIASNSWVEVVCNEAAKCPQKVNDEIYVQSIMYNQTSVTITIKFTEKSKYNLGDFKIDKLKEIGKEIKEGLREKWGLPNNVSLILNFVDKANRNLSTI